jgi:hypothetical protein
LSLKTFLRPKRPSGTGIGRVYPANIRPSHLHAELQAGARVSTCGDRAEEVRLGIA